MGEAHISRVTCSVLSWTFAQRLLSEVAVLGSRVQALDISWDAIACTLSCPRKLLFRSLQGGASPYTTKLSPVALPALSCRGQLASRGAEGLRPLPKCPPQNYTELVLP